MMQSLIGILSATDNDMVESKTALRFKNAKDFKCAESLIIHEQQLLSDERLFDACQREYNCILSDPFPSYVPKEILNLFEGKHVAVIRHDVADKCITVCTIYEYYKEAKAILIDGYKVLVQMVTLYKYVDLYTKQYGEPDFLSELPVKDKLDFIYAEALSLRASDITITNTIHGARVYYNARKKKVQSKRALKYKDVNEIAGILASSAKATLADVSAKPRYFSIDIDRHNRGRVVINKTYYGLLITIRVLPNTVLTANLEDWNIDPEVCEFIRETMLSSEKGLRLFIGETMSGKNTTIVTALREIVVKDCAKVVSVEQPVEILVDGIEQINAETDEEFTLNADSLLRQNPDIVYFTEITARTGLAILEQSNTSKAVFSTVHANSIAEVLFRLQDITKLDIDRILLALHSCVYQELVRDDKTDTVKPFNRCLYFSESLKMQLYGKSMAEIIGVLRAEEMRWGK